MVAFGDDAKRRVPYRRDTGNKKTSGAKWRQATHQIRSQTIGESMRGVIIAGVLSLFSVSAFAAPPTCRDEASAKKLAGAALTSFMDKCGRDAKTSCEGTANERKLLGAARTSFTKKCLSDMVGEQQ
jgi:hypothetical protein